ncbi:hypothetical protein K2X83_01085, partial [Patescibacteria group bacterium]|nr:hypothetical protein [Patescibacteria group bacterium]
SPSLQNLIRTKARPHDIRDEVIAAYYSTTVEDIGASYPSAISRGFDSLLIPILFCDGGMIPESVERELFHAQDAEGYELAHKYLGLMFFSEKKCVLRNPTYSLSKTLSESARRMRLQTGQWGDLYAEQIAFLYYGGFGSFVTNTDIRTILKNQNSDGGWGDGAGKPSNPHTTALAIWALSQSTGRCPFSTGNSRAR